MPPGVGHVVEKGLVPRENVAQPEVVAVGAVVEGVQAAARVAEDKSICDLVLYCSIGVVFARFDCFLGGIIVNSAAVPSPE